MNRIAIGGASTLLLVTAGFFLWQGYAESGSRLPSPPASRPARPAELPRVSDDSQAAESPARVRSREEKRFNRLDRDKDGRITRAEMMEPRRKAFAKLDANHDGRLSFEEWAGKTDSRFERADADHDGSLSRTEFATTRRKTRPKTARCACRGQGSDGDDAAQAEREER
jgi:hypothetical protein